MYLSRQEVEGVCGRSGGVRVGGGAEGDQRERGQFGANETALLDR